ncbi:hypothetical protein [Virgibacillus salexigens]|uniref:hypothetical protein n=1 Tax=Virgibacillus salexigens TaxID=61016 RepID=UPI003081EEE5
MMVHESIDDILITDQMEVTGVTTARNVVQERMENKRQIVLSGKPVLGNGSD